jgi:hypothetical protein
MPPEKSTPLEEVIARVKAADPSYPLSISAIPAFPFSRFTDMQTAVQEGRFSICRFAFAQEPEILELVAPSNARLHQISTLATLLIPLMSLVLAFVVSGWFAFGVLYFLVGTRLTSQIWASSLFRAASDSEQSFCFLFYCSKINCYDLTTRSEYEWQQLIKRDSR